MTAASQTAIRVTPNLAPSARAVLALACAAHVLHDGFSDALYVLLPLWAAELPLSLTQVGALRALYTGGMAAAQIPAGILAERWRERWLLAIGTAVTATGFVAAAGATGSVALGAVLLVAGLGSGVQHPLASALVSRAFEARGRRAALGTYNFAGDLGKVAAPALVGLAAAALGWRAAASGLGAIGLAGAVTLLYGLSHLARAGTTPAIEPTPTPGERWGIRDRRGFGALAAVGMIDTATRTGLLTFLPFLLMAKGLSLPGLGVALAVLFAGGAAGKFACGLVAERVGVIRTVILTEAATATGIALVAFAPLSVALIALLPLGVVLNGTSSVLYATVADLVAPARRARAYGLYYTLIVAASAAAPVAYGLLGDLVGLPGALAITGLIVLTTLPLCLALRPAVAVGGQGR